MDRATLMKNMHVNVGTFRKIIQTLHMCEMIEEEHVSRNKGIYSLKNAA